jgi:hypothetical protein
MEQSLPWAANSRSASQYIPRLLWKHERSLPCSQDPRHRAQSWPINILFALLISPMRATYPVPV